MAAAASVRDEDVGAIPFVGGDGQFQGIIADWDITLQVVAAGENPAEGKGRRLHDPPPAGDPAGRGREKRPA
jgi:CBS domain-containing protein